MPGERPQKPQIAAEASEGTIALRCYVYRRERATRAFVVYSGIGSETLEGVPGVVTILARGRNAREAARLARIVRAAGGRHEIMTVGIEWWRRVELAIEERRWRPSRLDRALRTAIGRHPIDQARPDRGSPRS